MPGNLRPPAQGAVAARVSARLRAVSGIKAFERVLWGIRYVIIIPVVAVAAAAVGVVLVTTLEAVQFAGSLQTALGAGAANGGRIVPLGSVLQMVEGYLLAAILLIFALGLYELFIARIDVAGSFENAPRALIIRDVDDLKERLGRVVMIALVIEFFQQSLHMDYTRPIELLYMALGILLVGAALYLTAIRRSAGGAAKSRLLDGTGEEREGTDVGAQPA